MGTDGYWVVMGCFYCDNSTITNWNCVIFQELLSVAVVMLSVQSCCQCSHVDSTVGKWCNGWCTRTHSTDPGFKSWVDEILGQFLYTLVIPIDLAKLWEPGRGSMLCVILWDKSRSSLHTCCLF